LIPSMNFLLRALIVAFDHWDVMSLAVLKNKFLFISLAHNRCQMSWLFLIIFGSNCWNCSIVELCYRT
jgi:hypothetical protein